MFPEGISAVTSPTAGGSRSGRFSTRPGECSSGDRDASGACKRYHTQVAKATNEVPGTESWWSWSILWPSGFTADTSVFNKYGDWHPRSGSLPCQTNVSIGLDERSPGSDYPLELYVRGGASCSDYNSKTVPLGSITPGKWMKFVWHIRWSQGSDGLVELWINGVKKASVEGPNMYSYLPSGRYDVFLKQGIYTGKTTVGQTIYVDEIVRGTARKDVDNQVWSDADSEEPPAPPDSDGGGSTGGGSDGGSSSGGDSGGGSGGGSDGGSSGGGSGGGTGSSGGTRERLLLRTFQPVVEGDCSACKVALARRGVTASVGSAYEPAAYGLRDFGGPSGWSGRVWTRDMVRLAPGHESAVELSLFQVRDVNNRLVYELVADENRVITFRSPAQALSADRIDLATGVRLPLFGRARRLEVSARANDSVVVRVDGVQRLAVAGLSGATTGNQRYIRAGLMSRNGRSPAGRTYARHDGVGVSRVRWLGTRALLRPDVRIVRRPRATRDGRLRVRAAAAPRARVWIYVRGKNGGLLGATVLRAGSQGYATGRVRVRRYDKRKIRVRAAARFDLYGAKMSRKTTKTVRLSRSDRRRLG